MISSLSVPSNPCTLDTTQALIKEELKNCLIHEGIGRGAELPLKNSIFYKLILKTTLELCDIKTIQYDKTGPSAYSGGKWNFHSRRKRIKCTHGTKYVDDSTEDKGTEDEDTEGEATEGEDTEGEDTEGDEDGDIDVNEAEIKGKGLSVELSYNSVIPGQSESETWDSQEYWPSGSKKRCRQVPVKTTEKEFQHLFYTIQYHLRHKLKPHLSFNIVLGSQYWPAEFSTSPIPDEYNSQKPDIALFDFVIQKVEKTWADVLSFVEHTSSDLTKKRDIPVFWGSTIKAYLIMRDQLHPFEFSTWGAGLGEGQSQQCLLYHGDSVEEPWAFLSWNRNEYALKDCWVTEEKRNHETTILEMVKGIPDVVQLIDHWDVCYEGEPDCMVCICIAHQMMIEKQVLHGDLSPNNFVIHNGIGYFINFDHASILAEGMTSTYSHGTGTMPYISICILQAMLDLVPLEANVNIHNQDANLDDVNDINVSKNIDVGKNTDVGENINFVSQDTNALQDANVLQNVTASMHLIEHWPSDDLELLFYIFSSLL
ncbi:hypothetical protein DFH29DRAFT_879204 [Suillus ampliporus]|nr:hypothetical protein DFH29DRAFT_879204 [Suillus ampliporus]